MADTERPSPFIWVTWLAGLLSGDKHCRYSVWYKSHHQYEKRPDPEAVRLAEWKRDHAKAVVAQAEALREAGYAVYLEEQNKFFMRGQTATLSGCPDIVAVRLVPVQEPRGFQLTSDIAPRDPEPVHEIRIDDCKTGQRRDSDLAQVAIYQSCAPTVYAKKRGQAPALDPAGLSVACGALVYKDGTVDVPPVPAERSKQVFALARSIGSTYVPPEATPSPGECKFCDIASCRWRSEDFETEVDTELF